MRLLFITAGAAGMYCGSCFRDNALACELIARGHDVTLLPLYTPTRTDEANVSAPRVFFGGISTYLQQHYGLFRATPRFVDRLWDSAPALRLASRGSLAVDPAFLGEMTVSVLRGERGHQRKEVGKLIDWLVSQPRPDLVVLPNSLLIGLAGPLRRALACPVCCTLQGEDLFLGGLRDDHREEALGLIRAAAADVEAFVAVSDYYAAFMAGYLGIPGARMHVVPLGINLTGYPLDAVSPQRDDAPFTLGYFARVAPEKGLHVLADAYRRLRDLRPDAPARLLAAGYLAPEHRGYLDGIQRTLRERGLHDEFDYRGELDRQAKIEFLSGLDVLSVPSPYDEPKGLFLLEAMACGVPVVQPRRGAYTEILERTGGGILVPPDDVEALAHALADLLADPGRRRGLGARGAEGVRSLHDVGRMADRAIEVFARIAPMASRESPCSS